MDYKVCYKKSVQHDLKLLGKPAAKKIINKIEKDLPQKALSCPVLKGSFAGLRKFRVGDYRVIFAILIDELLILRIAHRKEVYRE
ncbi:MAG: type II toxin-antitoxin system RelE/ParE family toxin [Deltaproteobacteria bacterium]|nr:type II toxin-antitoxin system RelE/ParE family toxin [Deltaproteobacteria bacterium]